ncbi:DTD1 [Bugula neritina]|uniref:D-aminoacyl-tRNA deacylase n=1 Tax=Bugula neritina TaxID=10212 RepID=A0A7J7K7J4_BUGNE|nr:DTD1 [Bugula neritina]
MKAIIQRVTKASVTVGDELVSSIEKGLCILLGISKDDTPADVQYMTKKILNLRLFEDDNGKSWNKSVLDKGYEVLCISQFTLSCVLKGNKPDFHQAMSADQSHIMYNSFLDLMRSSYSEEKIKDGRFQAYMQVHIQNDGPVTIPLESPSSVRDSKDAVKAARAEARQSKEKKQPVTKSMEEPVTQGETT